MSLPYSTVVCVVFCRYGPDGRDLVWRPCVLAVCGLRVPGSIMDARPPHHSRDKSTAPSNWSGETGARGKETRSVPNDVTDDLRAWPGQGLVKAHVMDQTGMYQLISHDDAAPQLSSGTATPQHQSPPGSHGAYRPTASTHTHYEDGVTRWSTPAGALCRGWTHRTFQRSIPCVHPNSHATNGGIPLSTSPTIGMAEREPALVPPRSPSMSSSPHRRHSP